VVITIGRGDVENDSAKSPLGTTPPTRRELGCQRHRAIGSDQSPLEIVGDFQERPMSESDDQIQASTARERQLGPELTDGTAPSALRGHEPSEPRYERNPRRILIAGSVAVVAAAAVGFFIVASQGSDVTVTTDGAQTSASTTATATSDSIRSDPDNTAAAAEIEASVPPITSTSDEEALPPSTRPSSANLAVAALDDGVVTFTDFDALQTSTVQLRPPTPAFAQTLVHYSGGVAYVAEGRVLYVVRPDAPVPIETLGPFSTIGPVSDDGFWRSVARAGNIDRIDWSFQDFAGNVGPPISLALSEQPFGEVNGALAVWAREDSQVLLVTPDDRVVLTEDGHFPLTSGDDTVIVLLDRDVIEYSPDGSSRILLSLDRSLGPASTLDATAISQNKEEVAILVKDRQTYEVVGLIIVDLLSGNRTDYPLDDGSVVAWLDDSRLLISGTLSAPYVFDPSDSTTIPLVSIAGQVLPEHSE